MTTTAEIIEGVHLNAMMVKDCPNKSKHVSAYPAGDRKKCPYCQQVYVRKVAKC